MALQSANCFLYLPTIHNRGAISGVGYSTVDAAEELVAWIFRVPKTGTLKKVGWSIGGVCNLIGTITISLESVSLTDYTAPVASTNATKTLYAANAEGTQADPAVSTLYWTPINGSSGISVTKNDLIAVTARVTAFTSGSARINYGLSLGEASAEMQFPNLYTYLNSTGANVSVQHALGLEYDGEIVPYLGALGAACSVVATGWGSNDSPALRGLKFKLPFPARLVGVTMHLDVDENCDVHVFDSDEYTELCSAPITLDKDVKISVNARGYLLTFAATANLLKDTWYRIAVEPKTTTDIGVGYMNFVDDSSLKGIESAPGGANFIYTTTPAVPTSGSHVWTDDDTKRPFLGIIVDAFDDAVSAGGGRPEFRGCNL